MTVQELIETLQQYDQRDEVIVYTFAGGTPIESVGGVLGHLKTESGTVYIHINDD